MCLEKRFLEKLNLSQHSFGLTVSPFRMKNKKDEINEANAHKVH